MKSAIQQSASLCLGENGKVLGQLTYTKSGIRENSSFAYSRDWLLSVDRFSVSPDLPLIDGHQYHKAASANDSVFHLAIADTEPDGWGCRVIARDYAKQRKLLLEKGSNRKYAPLTPWDYLIGVDDACRIGALRLRDENGHYLRNFEAGEQPVPPLLELNRLLDASNAVERKTETEADLRYLTICATMAFCMLEPDNGDSLRPLTLLKSTMPSRIGEP